MTSLHKPGTPPLPMVGDLLWAMIQPLLPQAKPRRFRHPGRLPVSDRVALNGILFVLASGIRWAELPSEMGYGSGVTCWRRLRAWQSAGAWARVCDVLVRELSPGHQINFSRTFHSAELRTAPTGALRQHHAAPGAY